MNQPSDLRDFDKIVYFRIRKENPDQDTTQHHTTVVFKNHFQMCPIIIEVLAYKGDQPVEIDPSLISIIDMGTREDLLVYDEGGLWPLDKWHWSRKRRYEGTILYDESFIHRVDKLVLDARLAIEHPALPMTVRGGRYESLTSPGTTWDKQWFDGLVDYHRTHKTGHGSLSSFETTDEQRKRLNAWARRAGAADDMSRDEALHTIVKDDDTQVVGAQVFRFYVSCPGRAPDDPITIAAGVRTSVGDTVYKSTTANKDIEDEDGQGDGSGRFYSTVTINAVTMPHLGLASYGVKMTGSVSTLHYSHTGITDDTARSFWHHLNVSFDAIPIPLWKLCAVDDPYADFPPAGGGLLRHTGKDNGAEWSTVMTQSPDSGTDWERDAAGMEAVGGGESLSMLELRQRYIKNDYSGPTAAGLVMIMGGKHCQFRTENHVTLDDSRYRSRLFALLDVHGNSNLIRVSIDTMNFIDIHDPW